MNYQVLFSLKNYEKVFMNVVCCSRDLVSTLTMKYRSLSDTVHWFLLVFPKCKCIPCMKPLSLVVTEKLT